MNTTEINTREMRAQHIVDRLTIKEKDGIFYVPSTARQTKSYRVDLQNGTCDCADYLFRRIRCKHIYAVAIFTEQRKVKSYEKIKSETKTRTELAQLPPRRTYSQKWSQYNRAQVAEKTEFLKLLAQLCAGIEEPEQTNGRPRMSLADMVFCCIYKTYSTVSGRRFAGELESAYELGYLSQLPSYHSMFRYFEKPELREILERLIVESSKPLSALESSFAVDATGLATTHGVTWHYAKYKDNGRMIAKRNWKKLHVLTGVVTNVIFAAKVTDKTEHEANYFAPLVETASENCDMKELLADAAYLSQANMQTALDHGAFPYLAWKSNNKPSAKKGNELWNKLFHLFSLNRSEFIKKYQKRSNCETAFSMLKMKFGGILRNKTSVSQENEALAKCLCHNICCLVSAMFELEIEPNFYN